VPYPCLGGQGTVPYEQKTQQSPGFGFTSTWQAGHSQNRTHASVGMMSGVSASHCGQRMVASVTGLVMGEIYWHPQPPVGLLTKSMADRVPLMKAAFAALLLLFQLQPVLGTAACLGLSDRPAKEECKMPEHGQPQSASVAVSGASAQSCQLATICTPAPLAIPGLSNELETAVPLYGGAATLAATLPLGISPAPPFHPPRA
jgi:hypothetical protein